mmetsp:Transcript_32270/g.55115  ORF Transcript_32270/g.55115 Transcript_32270/m.55115 type:complete len:116 (-) Transcript_32270:11-358(-)
MRCILPMPFSLRKSSKPQVSTQTHSPWKFGRTCLLDNFLEITSLILDTLDFLEAPDTLDIPEFMETSLRLLGDRMNRRPRGVIERFGVDCWSFLDRDPTVGVASRSSNEGSKPTP